MRWIIDNHFLNPPAAYAQTLAKRSDEMTSPKIGTKQEWLEARLELLKKEKAHSRNRDELTRERQALPWVKVEKEYTFEGLSGTVTLSDLFGDKNQLIVQHFMFDPEWDEGCKSCSFMADHMDPSVVHIAHRDTAFAAVSKAPLEKCIFRSTRPLVPGLLGRSFRSNSAT